MAIYRIEIAETGEGGERGVGLIVSGPNLVAGMMRARFKHHGYPRPYLHLHGWDVADNWIEMPAELTRSDQLTLSLPPALEKHFEENNNYLIELNLLGSESLKQGVRWSVSSSANARVSKPSTFVSPAVAPVAATTSEVREDMAWRVAQGIDSREAYAAFLAAHPSSRHVDEARSALTRHASAARPADPEELAWRAASDADSKASWTAFMIAYPHGTYAERAKVQLALFMPPCLTVRTRWSVIGAAAPYGVDTCAFLLNAASVVRGDADFISSWATETDTKTVLHHSLCTSVRNLGVTNDNARQKTETIAIELDQVPRDIEMIAITVSLNPNAGPHHSLSAVDSTMELIDAARSEVLLDAQIGEGAVSMRGQVILVLRRHGADWRLHRSSEAFKGGIFGLCERFGIVVA